MYRQHVIEPLSDTRKRIWTLVPYDRSSKSTILGIWILDWVHKICSEETSTHKTHVEGSYPTPHIHEQKTTSNYI